MRFLFAALMIALAIAAVCNIPEQIRNADRRGGHRVVELSAWPAFGPTPIRWPDPAAIERAIGDEWQEAHARFAGEPRDVTQSRRLTP